MESALWVLQSACGAGGQLASRAAALMALAFVLVGAVLFFFFALLAGSF